MANGYKCKDKSVVEAEETKKKSIKNEHDTDPDKDKANPKALGDRLARLEKLAGLR